MIERHIASVVLILGSIACATPPAQPEDELPRAGPGVLYAIGAGMGRAIRPYELDEDEVREVVRGLTDAAQGKPHAAPMDEDTPANLNAFHEQRLKALARREEAAGAPVLEAAAREPGAVKTESGMVMRVVERGSGPSPTIWDIVRIDYHGTRRDGTVFDSTQGREPLRDRLGTMTRCFQEAFASVAAGARMRVVCPPALAYGWAGWPMVLVGGAVVTYDLELLSVEPMPEPKE